MSTNLSDIDFPLNDVYKESIMIISSDKAIFSNGRYVADASDLGLKVSPVVIRFGDKGAFRFHHNNTNENELISIEYKNVTNNVLVIVND